MMQMWSPFFSVRGSPKAVRQRESRAQKAVSFFMNLSRNRLFPLRISSYWLGTVKLSSRAWITNTQTFYSCGFPAYER